MSDFLLPHVAPIKFVKSRLHTDSTSTTVELGFDEIPTLGMLIEAAAQSTAGISDEQNSERMGFLVSLKNVKLLQKIDSYEYISKIELLSKLDNFKSLKFEIYKDEEMIAKGFFAIVLQ
jgi:hypothetical protein